MEKNYRVEYELHYEGGSTSRHFTMITMDDISSSHVLSKIRESKNVNGYVRDIIILEVKEE